MSGLLSGIRRMFGQRGGAERGVGQGGLQPDWRGPCEAVLAEGLVRFDLPAGFTLERLLVNRYRVTGPGGAQGRIWLESLDQAESDGEPLAIREVPPALMILLQEGPLEKARNRRAGGRGAR